MFRSGKTCVAAFAALAAVAALAQSPPPSTKKDVPGGGTGAGAFAHCRGPIITVTGKVASLAGAAEDAKAKWMQAATAGHGPAYGDWNRSAQRSLTCPRSGPFNNRHICTARALPCR